MDTNPSSIKLTDEPVRKAAPGSLLDALHKRHTSREFIDAPLSERHLSQVLWAANGVNRPDGHRTAPSAMGFDTLRIYAVTESGVYFYEPLKNELEMIAAGDFRALAGSQSYVPSAPLSLAIYADYASFETDDPELTAALKPGRDRMAALDAGAAAENVYLYCASEGINVVERMMMDGEAFAKRFNLPPTYRFQVAMSLGYAE